MMDNFGHPRHVWSEHLFFSSEVCLLLTTYRVYDVVDGKDAATDSEQ